MFKAPSGGECDAGLVAEVAVGNVGSDDGLRVLGDPWALLEDAVLIEADV